eukprot:scaffold133288_cov78-Phaeocystis_antarctica.AAC.3
MTVCLQSVASLPYGSVMSSAMCRITLKKMMTKPKPTTSVTPAQQSSTYAPTATSATCRHLPSTTVTYRHLPPPAATGRHLPRRVPAFGSPVRAAAPPRRHPPAESPSSSP